MQKMVPWTALVIAVIACAVSLYSALRPVPSPDESAIENRVYRRIVREVAHELAPVYKDFDMGTPGEPETLTDLIRPLLSVEPKLPKQPSTAPGGQP
jgi:hypothetical protein